MHFSSKKKNLKKHDFLTTIHFLICILIYIVVTGAWLSYVLIYAFNRQKSIWKLSRFPFAANRLIFDNTISGWRARFTFSLNISINGFSRAIPKPIRPWFAGEYPAAMQHGGQAHQRTTHMYCLIFFACMLLHV